MPLKPERLPDAYRQMLIIRKFEEAIRGMYQQGKIRGSFHPCVGQEATAVGGCWPLRQDDAMSCTYRGHGHALAKGLTRAPPWLKCWAKLPAVARVRAVPCTSQITSMACWWRMPS